MGVLADTHCRGGLGSLPSPVVSGLKGLDFIIHAGDVGDQALVEDLKRLAPLVLTPGNLDTGPEFESWHPVQVSEWEGWRIGVTHGHLGKGRNALERSIDVLRPRGVDVIIFGHSHHPFLERVGRALMFNPGSARLRRREPRLSYGVLELEKRTLRATLVFFDS